MNKYLIMMLLALWGVNVIAQTEDTPTDTLYFGFNESLQYLFSNSKSIQVANFQKEVTEHEKKATNAHRMPHIGVTGAYTIMDDDIEMHADLSEITEPLGQLLQGVGAILPPGTLPAISMPTDLGLTLQEQQMGVIMGTFSMPLYTGGKINAAHHAAEAKVFEASENLREVTNQQITELVTRYFGLQLTNKVLQIRNDALKNIENHLSNAKKLEEQGQIAHVERLHAEVAYANASREYRSSEKDMEITQKALQNTLGTNQVIVPMDELFIPKDIQSLDYYQSLAIQNSPLLGQIDAKKTLVNQKLKVERSKYLPDVALMGGANLYDYQLTEMAPQWFVGVGISINIFDGFERENKIRAAKTQALQVDNFYGKASDDIKMVVQKLYQTMEKAFDEYESLATTEAFAAEYLDAREKAFTNGLATSTDVVDAQLNMEKVKIAKLQAAYAYDVALASMLQYCGASNTFEQYR
ncbi:TolC family protein [Carboxylicivirga caseinilyticus]|uniref:TolC family protein n=1 Tax=Carboxylicivirga caseinilyticus TaxID=3417572 RepID=UPI003D327E78|nr:TolC family protein [Marinilabiliaceae bacterium A049]